MKMSGGSTFTPRQTALTAKNRGLDRKYPLFEKRLIILQLKICVVLWRKDEFRAVLVGDLYLS